MTEEDFPDESQPANEDVKDVKTEKNLKNRRQRIMATRSVRVFITDARLSYPALDEPKGNNGRQRRSEIPGNILNCSG